MLNRVTLGESRVPDVSKSTVQHFFDINNNNKLIIISE